MTQISRLKTRVHSKVWPALRRLLNMKLNSWNRVSMATMMAAIVTIVILTWRKCLMDCLVRQRPNSIRGRLRREPFRGHHHLIHLMNPILLRLSCDRLPLQTDRVPCPLGRLSGRCDVEFQPCQIPRILLGNLCAHVEVGLKITMDNIDNYPYLSTVLQGV